MTRERVVVISGWRLGAMLVLLGLMFLLACVGVLAIIIGIVEILPRIAAPMKGIP